MNLSRQQKILVKYLSDGEPHTTFEITKRMFLENGGVWLDIRKRASELKKLGLLISDSKTPASYSLTESGIIEARGLIVSEKPYQPILF
jgi:hypothetical protein